jgi:hypothetical protein
MVAFGMRLVDLWSLYGRSVVGLAQGHFWGCVKGEAIVLSRSEGFVMSYRKTPLLLVTQEGINLLLKMESEFRGLQHSP